MDQQLHYVGLDVSQLLAGGGGAASRHAQLSQYGVGPNRGNGLQPVKRGECNRTVKGFGCRPGASDRPV